MEGAFWMKKYLSLLAALILIFAISSCEESDELSESSEPETFVESSESESSWRDGKQLFEVSIVTDADAEPVTVEPDMEWQPFEIVTDEDIKMTPECQEIFDKYVSPIANSMPLMTEFTEDKAPKGIYTYIFFICEWLDRDVYGMKTSGYDMAESYWVDGRKVESSIARWFTWSPEDYREYFEYDEKADKYLIVGCGGGPIFPYVTDYERDGDILTIYISFYSGLGSGGYYKEEPYFLTYKTVLKVKEEEIGWKYLSNTKTYSKENIPFFFNDDFTVGANMAGRELWEWEKYHIFKDSVINYVTIPKYVSCGSNIDIEKSTCLFFAQSGLWIYDMGTGGLRHIESLPSEEDGIHSLYYAWIDSENRLVITYILNTEVEEGDTVESVSARAGNIQVAALDFDTLEPLNAFDTGIPTHVYKTGDGKIHISAAANLRDENAISVYDMRTDSWKYIKYMD